MKYQPHDCLDGQYFKCISTSVPEKDQPKSPGNIPGRLDFNIPTPEKEDKSSVTTTASSQVVHYKKSSVRKIVYKFSKK